MNQIVKIVGSPPEEWINTIKNLRNWEYKKVDKNLSTYFDNVDIRILDLLNKMLEIVPSKRITAQAILKHKFFDDSLDL